MAAAAGRPPDVRSRVPGEHATRDLPVLDRYAEPFLTCRKDDFRSSVDQAARALAEEAESKR